MSVMYILLTAFSRKLVTDMMSFFWHCSILLIASLYASSLDWNLRVIRTEHLLSKSALNGFTKSLAKELGSRNITVNCVAPGYIDTDMTSFLDEDSKKQIEKSIPLGRLGSGEDISKLVAFLASDEASYITGQTISIDGGLLMY